MCEIGVGFSFAALSVFRLRRAEAASALWIPHWNWEPCESQGARADRKSTRLNSSHVRSSYAVFCLKKKRLRRREGRHACAEQLPQLVLRPAPAEASGGRRDLHTTRRRTHRRAHRVLRVSMRHGGDV